MALDAVFLRWRMRDRLAAQRVDLARGARRQAT
jgi:hypothetical protein